ncbi:hypothetical protein [Deinococcus sp. ME38]|uniref:hypothetical protein n=1 Tax=Deinococcus sp. ME38 TaxID=3400344 RepID=UPI003B58BA13
MGIKGRRNTRSTEEIEAEWLNQRRSDTSVLKWADALCIDHTLCQVEGVLVSVTDWDAYEEAQGRAAQQLSGQWATNKAVRAWYAAQLREGNKVHTQQLAQRLGAQAPRDYSAFIQAFAYDLFHFDRDLYRALKTQEAYEAGLAGEELRAYVIRAIAEMVSEDDALQAHEHAESVALPLPIDSAPQIQPNAPSDKETSVLN